MSQLGHVLIIDDDPDFLAIYREMLEGLGQRVSAAQSAAEAIHQLGQLGSEIDVILLDQKLQGPGGPDSGLELIAQAQSLAPFAKLIVVTGYATADAIERAFRLGVYDYLVKNGAFDALLRSKVRNAIEVTRERRIAALTRERTLEILRASWTTALGERDRNRKGVLLEQVVALLFRSTPGFERVETRLDNAIEEIDVVVENRVEQGPLKVVGGAYLLAECKNWSSKCGAPEFRSFHEKLTTKYGHARVGLFFAPGGFTETFHEARARHSTEPLLVIPVDATGMQEWIDADDRLAALGELHRRAVFHQKA
jgi:CheY-like chemotaxis protein